MAKITVAVRVVGRRKTEKHRLPSGARIVKLLKEMGLNPETVVVRRNGKIVVEEERLTNEDSIEIVPIVTGG
jgi:thiamine biosynthesis protein ThiS